MPRLSETSVPTYRLHKQSGQAIVTLGGRDFLLGDHNSKESKAEYQRRIGEWLAAGRQLPADPNSTTIAEVHAAFRRFAKTYYRASTKAAYNVDEAMKYVLKLYGRMAAIDFGPLKLKVVREAMIADGRVRTNINRLIGRIKFVFRWASENEMIPASVFHGLSAVAGLKRGKSEAIEGVSVKPVAVEHVEAIKDHVSAQVWAMVQLQLITGMRSGELVIMRGCDIEAGGDLWLYRPSKHKTMNVGDEHAEKIIYLGPKGQEIIRPFLKPDLQANIFSPADAEAQRRQLLHEQRKTPLSCGNKPGSKRPRTERRVGNAYTVSSYYRAIQRGCAAAYPPPAEMTDPGQIKRWHKDHRFFPHRVRHTCATDLRKTFGLEGSQVVLGHKAISATQIYAEKNAELARKIMEQVG